MQILYGDRIDNTIVSAEDFIKPGSRYFTLIGDEGFSYITEVWKTDDNRTLEVKFNHIEAAWKRRWEVEKANGCKLTYVVSVRMPIDVFERLFA